MRKRILIGLLAAAVLGTIAYATWFRDTRPVLARAAEVTMIEAGDNVVTNTDAVDTFQLPLVPLEEQIRRAA